MPLGSLHIMRRVFDVLNQNLPPTVTLCNVQAAVPGSCGLDINLCDVIPTKTTSSIPPASGGPPVITVVDVDIELDVVAPPNNPIVVIEDGSSDPSPWPGGTTKTIIIQGTESDGSQEIADIFWFNNTFPIAPASVQAQGFSGSWGNIATTDISGGLGQAFKNVTTGFTQKRWVVTFFIPTGTTTGVFTMGTTFIDNAASPLTTNTTFSRTIT